MDVQAGHNSRIVTDEQVDEALQTLVRNAVEIGEATEQLRRAEAMTKHRLALEMKLHGKLPVSGQEREARASLDHVGSIDAEAKAAGNLARLRAVREAASMTIEIWRTQSSNYRSMKF